MIAGLKEILIRQNETIEAIDRMGAKINELRAEEFFLRMCFLTPQSYGAKIEKYVIEKINAKKLQAKNNNGDFELDNEKYELKVSIVKGKNKHLNLVQIRLHADVDKYMGLLIDPMDMRNSNVFILTKEEMSRELPKTSFAHGTKETNKTNENVEYRLTVSKEQFEKYRNKKMEEIIFDL